MMEFKDYTEARIYVRNTSIDIAQVISKDENIATEEAIKLKSLAINLSAAAYDNSDVIEMADDVMTRISSIERSVRAVEYIKQIEELVDILLNEMITKIVRRYN